MLLAVSVPGAAQDSAPGVFSSAQLKRIHEGLQAIYNLEHARAAAIFERMIKDAPDDPTGYAYLAMTLWLRELSGRQELSIDRFAASDFFAETPSHFPTVEPRVESRFRALSERAVDLSRQRLSDSPGDRQSLFLLGLAYQNLASFEVALKRNWWAAFRYGSHTFAANRELLRRDARFYDALLAIGVYHYVVGNLGWSVRWLALLLGYRGSRARGKRELEVAARQGQLVGDDARVILVLILTRERDYRGASGYLEELLRKYPRNYLVHLDIAGLKLRMGRPREAIAVYREILRKHDNREPNYQHLERAAVLNRLGVACRAQRDLAASAAWFQEALGEPGLSPRASALAHLELAKTLDLAGKRAEALEHYRIAASAADYSGSREEARGLLARPYRQ